MPVPVEVPGAYDAGRSTSSATSTGPLESPGTDHLHVRQMGVGAVARGPMMVAR